LPVTGRRKPAAFRELAELVAVFRVKEHGDGAARRRIEAGHAERVKGWRVPSPRT
jgi:hypothetical protein